MKEIINGLWASFNTYEKGASARKLTAFALMVLIAYCHIKYVDNTNVIEAIIIDLSGVLLCLGLVTASNIIELKNGSKKDEPTN
jgi:hypothetical protein